MAIVVLVLWLLTAGAGLYLLVTGNLRPAVPGPDAAAAGRAPQAASVAAPAEAAPARPAGSPARGTLPTSRRQRRAARDKFAPPSLTAARNAPVVPGLRSLVEFAHPACALIGFGFWMGYTFVHYRTLGWIGLGLVAITAALGLTWFAASARAARQQPGHQPPPFSRRLLAVHGGAAAFTVVLAALAALVLRG